MKEMTPEQRKKIRGEREWQRIQAEQKFYAGFANGPIVFTRPGSAPVAPTPLTQSQSRGELCARFGYCEEEARELLRLAGG